MRFHSTTFLGFTLLILALDILSATINAIPLNPSARRALQSYKAPKRLLSPGEGDYESRAASLSAVGTTIKAAAPALKTMDKLQLKWWLFRNKRSVDVLKKLEFGINVDDVLANPKLSILQRYVSMYNKKNPKNTVTVVETLATKYGEVPMIKMLELAKTSGKSSDTTKALAAELQLEHFTTWLNKKISPVDIYKQLELNSPTTSPFSSPVFRAWMSYLDMFNNGKGGEAAITVLQVLKTVYGKRALASLLYKTEGKLDPEKTAATLKSELYAEWKVMGITGKNFFSRVFNIHDSRATTTDREVRIEYLQMKKTNEIFNAA